MIPNKPPRKGPAHVDVAGVNPVFADLVLARPKGKNVELVFYATHLGTSAVQDGSKVAIHSGADEEMLVKVVGVVVLPIEQAARLKRMLPSPVKGPKAGQSPFQPDKTP
ncbi:MAG: hypothetical protein ACW976_01625 [Candidatus Ranarchaeia archaeon]|jgi:hypothetical protein